MKELLLSGGLEGEISLLKILQFQLEVNKFLFKARSNYFVNWVCAILHILKRLIRNFS